MKKKALITAYTFHEQGVEMLKEAGYEIIFDSGKSVYKEQDLFELINDIDVYIAGTDPISKDVIDRAARLKLITRCGVGYDSVDWIYAQQKGIPVTITPGTNETSVAEMVFALLLGLARNIPMFDREVHNGIWRPQILGVELNGKTIGIIGTGRVGKAVAQRARGFGMVPIAYDPYADQRWAEELGVKYVDLDELTGTSDIITLHAPLTPDTENMVNADFLNKMKRSAFLINTARGRLLDEHALYNALAEGRIAGAALDVFIEEPLTIEHPLLGLKNCIVSCHVSSHTVEAIKQMSVMCVYEILRMERGEKPMNSINGF